MSATTDDADERQRQRATKEQARGEGIGQPPPGEEPPARDYADETGVTDLGQGEPVVPEPLRGERPDEP